MQEVNVALFSSVNQLKCSQLIYLCSSIKFALMDFQPLSSIVMHSFLIVYLARVSFFLSVAAASPLAPPVLHSTPVIANLSTASTETPGLICFTTRSLRFRGPLTGCEGPIYDVCAPPAVITPSECSMERLFGRSARYRTPLNWESSQPSVIGMVCRVEFLKRNMRQQTPITFSFKAIQNTAQKIVDSCSHKDQRLGGLYWIGATEYYVQVAMDRAGHLIH